MDRSLETCSDPIRSAINFSVRHLMVGKIHGRFDQFSGAITITEDGTPSVTAEMVGHKVTITLALEALEQA
jgi:polyisoprenoid-binding protein YceI